jgi:hypothetical protein
MLYADPPYYQRRNVNNNPNQVAFMFKSLGDYRRFIAETEQRCTGNCRTGYDRIGNQGYVQSAIRNNGQSWFGTNDADAVTNITDYLFNVNLNRELDAFRDRMVRVNKTDIDRNVKIKFTEMEVGIFSFDLASLGLIPVYEFYSPLLKKVISPNLVVSEKTPSGETLFFHVYQSEIPEHIVRYESFAKGNYSNILKRVVNTDEVIKRDLEIIFPFRAEISKHLVERRQQLDANGKAKFSSTFKKSFIELPKVEKPLPRIDIVIGISPASDRNAETEMLYTALSALAIADKLGNSGIPFRIVASFGVKASRDRNKKAYGFITLKKEGEIFNRNQLSITLSDARFIRYEGFKGYLALQYDAGFDNETNPSTIGAPLDESNDIKNAYLNFLSTSNDVNDIKASTMPDTKLVFAGSYSRQQAENEFNQTINTISSVI